VPRVLIPLVIGGLASFALAGCSGHPAHAATARTHCGLVTSGAQGGRAVVSYEDSTGVPAMSTAISAAVAAWNATSAPVMLKATTSNPALTFNAGHTQPPLPPCTGTAPRMVSLTWNTKFWSAAGGKQAVLDPTGDAEHAIAHALGLIPGGHCPTLMAKGACPHRTTTPTASQLQVLAKLYKG